MFTAKVIGDKFDSLLEMTNGKDPFQNAWLTIEIKVALNFVNPGDKLFGRTVDGQQLNQPGKWFAQDLDNWLFPMLSWTEKGKQEFRDSYQKIGEQSWNYKFLLITPRDYSEFDYADHRAGWMVRPNVICLFRLRLVGAGSTLHPEDTISGNLTSHRLIDVVKLEKSTTTVHRFRTIKGEENQFTKQVGKMDGFTWRSSVGAYDDNDLFNPSHNIIGHEVGHLLDERHIMCLGDNPLAICKENGNDKAAYGSDYSNPNDAGNVMGGGNDLTLLNAQPWTNRILRHTLRRFDASTIVETHPRKINLTRSMEGTSVF